MKVTAFVPIKLNNQRLPGKNLLPLAGKPLCTYIFETLTKVSGIDEIYAYCSDAAIQKYLPENVMFLQRDKALDADEVKGISIYQSFVQAVDSDLYVLAHATSPFVESTTIEKALVEVLQGEFDSAFSAQRAQTFAWYDGHPLNYELDDVIRTQDISPVWLETSAFYIFDKDMIEQRGRRIGDAPYIAETGPIESIDIDEKVDYEFACTLMGEK